MQQVVSDKPYQFIPPNRNPRWPAFFQLLLRRYLNKAYGIVGSEIRGAELLRASVQAGHGILLTPNHCRLSDPLVMGLLAREAGVHLYAMASWHVFWESRLARFVAPRLGAFSVYREGLDRTALNTAIDILATAERPLLMFPEGVVSRHNDLLNALMDGASLIARSAARKREKQTPPGKVVVHPIGLKYFFGGDLEASVDPVLSEIESMLFWRPRKGRSLYRRIKAIGQALLALKEIEYLGAAQTGPIYQRSAALIDQLLVPLEKEWLGAAGEGSVVVRVKRLRSAVVPDMVKTEMPPAERERRWWQLGEMNVAQQLGFYPAHYLDTHPSRERFLETVERFEEDLKDKARSHRPLTVVIQVAPAIEVSPVKPKAGADPLMEAIESQLKTMLAALAQQAPADPQLLE